MWREERALQSLRAFALATTASLVQYFEAPLIHCSSSTHQADFTCFTHCQAEKLIPFFFFILLFPRPNLRLFANLRRFLWNRFRTAVTISLKKTLSLVLLVGHRYCSRSCSFQYSCLQSRTILLPLFSVSFRFISLSLCLCLSFSVSLSLSLGVAL